MIHKKIQLYEDRADVTLTTYVLDDSPEMLDGGYRPAVLVCPGGAYLGCSDREAEPVALRFAAMGYHAFVLRYSTYFGGQFGADPFTEVSAVNPRSVHPGPVRDIGKAFLMIREHADDWLVDMDKITICGFSAGGHNCAMYAVYWDKPLISDHFGVDALWLKPAAAILGYALTDYHLMFGRVLDPLAQEISNAASIAFLGTTSPTDIFLDEVSPAKHVSSNTPPTFIWTTMADELVPAEHSTRMANALAAAGVPCEIHLFEEGKHGLSLADQSSAGSLLDIEAEAAQWIVRAEAWLKKRFALDLPLKPAWMVELEENRGGQN